MARACAEDEDERWQDSLESELEDEERLNRWLELADSEKLTSQPDRFSGFIGKSEWADHCRLNSLRELGWSVLHSAASNDNVGACTELLEQRKIPVDTRDVRGQTPLHLAAKAGAQEVVRLLCERGASVCSRTKASNTPLMLARDAFAKVSSNQNHKRRANSVDGQDVKVPFWFQRNELTAMLADIEKQIKETKANAKKTKSQAPSDKQRFSMCLSPHSSRSTSSVPSLFSLHGPACNTTILVLCLALWEAVPHFSHMLTTSSWWRLQVPQEQLLLALSLIVVAFGAVLFALVSHNSERHSHDEQLTGGGQHAPASATSTNWPATVKVTSTGTVKLDGYRVAPGQDLQLGPEAGAGLCVVFEADTDEDPSAKRLTALQTQLKTKTREHARVCQYMAANKVAEEKLMLTINYLDEQEKLLEVRLEQEEEEQAQQAIRAQQEWMQQQEQQVQQEQEQEEKGTPISDITLSRVPLSPLTTPENLTSEVRSNVKTGYQGKQIGTPGASTPQGRQIGTPGASTPQGRQIGTPGASTPQGRQIGTPGASTPQGRQIGTPGAATPKGRIGMRTRLGTPFAGGAGAPGRGTANTPERWSAATRLQLQHSPSVHSLHSLHLPSMLLHSPSLPLQSPSATRSPAPPQQNRLLSLSRGSMGMGASHVSPSRMSGMESCTSPGLPGQSSPMRIAASPGAGSAGSGLLSPQLRMLYEVVLFVPDASDAFGACGMDMLPRVALFPTSKVASHLYLGSRYRNDANGFLPSFDVQMTEACSQPHLTKLQFDENCGGRASERAGIGGGGGGAGAGGVGGGSGQHIAAVVGPLRQKVAKQLQKGFKRRFVEALSKQTRGSSCSGGRGGDSDGADDAATVAISALVDEAAKQGVIKSLVQYWCVFRSRIVIEQTEATVAAGGGGNSGNSGIFTAARGPGSVATGDQLKFCLNHHTFRTFLAKEGVQMKCGKSATFEAVPKADKMQQYKKDESTGLVTRSALFQVTVNVFDVEERNRLLALVDTERWTNAVLAVLSTTSVSSTDGTILVGCV
jgi:hypothetical protein